MRQDDDRRRMVGLDSRPRLAGQATTSSSALGIRSFVANFVRASATIVRQPIAFAARQSPFGVAPA